MTDQLSLLVSSWQRLADSAAGLTDDDCRAPSGLPGWSRGHVLTHVARNADAMVNLLVWASTGQERPMYASPEARDADIEAGAHRSARELVDDLTESHVRMLAAADELAEEDWQSEVVARGGRTLQAAYVPWLRLGETEIHHTDLAVGYPTSSWPAGWVSAYLPHAAGSIEQRAGTPLRLQATDATISVGADDPTMLVSGPQVTLLAWVVGRGDGAGLVTEPEQPLPDLGAWR